MKCYKREGEMKIEFGEFVGRIYRAKVLIQQCVSTEGTGTVRANDEVDS